MLEKIEIRNFGNHTKQDVEFGKGVTSIIGSSYAGKSTIVRALKWVGRNKPAGDWFISWGTDKASVRLSFDGRRRVTRKRSKSQNTYRFDKMDYSAFGNDVPPTIGDALNIADINFQRQHAAPFWFCETAGEVSRQLNAIINLEVIDTTLSNIASKLHKSRVAVELIQERLDKAVERKRNLAYVGRLNEDLLVIEGCQDLLRENAAECSELLDLLKVRENYLSVRERALELASDGLNAVSAGASYQKVVSQTGRLSELMVEGRRLQRVVKARPSSLKPLERLRVESEKAEGKYCCLLVMIAKIKTEKEIICQAEKELRISKKAFKDAVGEICPLCSQPMPK